MANRVALLTPLLAWTAALLAAQWPASVMASEFQCGHDSPDSGWCRPQNIRDDLWRASIECSDDAITIQVQQTGDRSSIRNEYYREVLIQCTNGNDQAEIPVNCSIEEERTYARTISDISAVGIKSGWTCSFSGCFQVNFNNGDRSYYHTAMDSCTLPIDPTTTEEPTMTSTEADVTTTSTEDGVTEPTTTSTEADVTMTMGTITSTEVDSGTDATDPTQTALVIIPVIVVLLGLITVTSLMILFINSRMKQQKARKTALLILDRNNMVFDPDYIPGIHIDKQSYTHRTSVISNMDYLHFVVEKPSQYPADVQVVTFDEKSYTIDSSFDHDLNMSNSKQHSSTMVGAAKDMVINPQEFPGSGTSGYIISGDSNGFTSPQQMDTTELEFQSPSDSASELTQSCGGCQSSDYIGDAQLGNQSFMYDNVIAASQETSSEDTLSFFTPEDDPLKEAAGVVGLDRSSYPSSSSSAGYVEQLNASNQPLTRDDDNVFEPTHQQGDGYVQSQHPIPIASSTTTFSDQTSGYIVDLQNTHQLHTNLQDTEVACLDLDDMNCSQTVSNSTTDATQPTQVALTSCDQTFPLDMPQLTNTDRYIVNEYPTAMASEDCEMPELSIDLDCENTLEEGETDCEEPSHDVCGSSVEDRVNGRSLDKPCSPDKISSQGYITTEDIDMTKFTSREIVVPSNQVSPSQIEPGFTVHLDFNNGIDSCHGQEKDEVGYVCNSGCSGSGIETDRNRDMIQSSNQMAIDSNGYVANQPTSVLGPDKREQYVSYDFHSMSSELRDSQSTSVTPEPMATHNPDLGQMHIHYQAKSNYYPASDMSSGYLSGSSVSGDTSVYMGMDKFEQLDLYNYK